MKTLASSGWDTYISSITLYDANGDEISGLTDLSTNTGSNTNMDYLFDGSDVSVYKFPPNSLPEHGDYIQWRCSPACNVDAVEISQSTGGNNIPEWYIMYSPQDYNFTEKWSMVTISSPASSEAPPDSAPCIYFNATTSSKNSDSDSFPLYLMILSPILGVFILLFLVFLFKSKKRMNILPENSEVASKNVATKTQQIKPLSCLPTEAIARYNTFLSHDWGVDGGNHIAVQHIAAQLKKIGLHYWFDDERMQGNVVSQMTSGIENSNTFIVFITQRYMDKVNGHDERDNCKIEFQYAFNRLGPQKMVAVVLERELRDTKRWSGHIGAALGSHLYIDMVDALDNAEVMESQAKKLLDLVMSKSM